MKRTQAAQTKTTLSEGILYMAMELSASRWVLGFGNEVRDRLVSVAAWDTAAFLREVSLAKAKLGLPAKAPVLSVQEAGRDGFSVHRFVESEGIESLVVDSSSIEVPRRARRAKTDRADAHALLRMLRRYAGGERKVWRVVRVPSEARETERRLGRERERLTKERTSMTNRIRSILATQGIRYTSVIGSDFAERLQGFRRFDGTAMPTEVIEELLRAWERVSLIDSQRDALEARRRDRIRKDSDASAMMARRLTWLKGIGETTGWTLAQEFFWRDFRNRREVGSAAGLVPNPYQSGLMDRSSGINKAGSRRIRCLMVELAWRWLRWQPDSALSRWFAERFGSAGGRMRRVGIVALARKLLVELWRYLHFGTIPEGALIRSA